MKLAVMLYAAVILGLAAGWVMNIITIFNTADAPLTSVFILRCIGIVMAPLGGVLGWI